MLRDGYNVGGEQSGHIVLNDYTTTGDGLIAALQVLSVIVEENRPASAVTRVFDPLPQLLRNVRIDKGSPLEEASVKEAIEAAESDLDGKGRLLIRKSGTEPLLRVMAEGEDEALIGRVVGSLCETIEQAAG